MNPLTLSLVLLSVNLKAVETPPVHNFETLTLKEAKALNGKVGRFVVVSLVPVNAVSLAGIMGGEEYFDCRSADGTYRKLFAKGWSCEINEKLTVEATLRIVFHDNTNVQGVTGWWEYRLENAVRRK